MNCVVMTGMDISLLMRTVTIGGILTSSLRRG